MHDPTTIRADDFACTRFCSPGTGPKLTDRSWCDHPCSEPRPGDQRAQPPPCKWRFKFRVSPRVQNGVEFSRFDGSVFSLNVLECHLANALHPRSLFLWTLGKNPPKEWKIRGIASSVSTAAHLNTVPKSPVPTSRLSLPTCTPPTMSRLFLLLRS